MKKILILAVFAASFFLLSCGGAKNNLADGDRDETDSVSDASDPSDDSGDTSPDDTSDTTSDDDIDDITSDDGDSEDSMEDIDQGGHSGDSDTWQDPCDPNPCADDSNSTHECTVTGGTTYSCACNEGYYWWGPELGCMSEKPVSIGNICTGQTSCYDASYDIYVDMPISTASIIPCPDSSSEDFYGQDAWYASLGYCIPQSFSSSSNVVVDNNTGLTWEKSPSAGTYIWEDRAEHCNELNGKNYAEKSNWRVPNPIELLTIVDNGKEGNPATNSDFTEMPADNNSYLWTSKEYKSDTSYAYAFRPYDGMYMSGAYDRFLKTNTYNVLCVSGNEILPAASSDFTESSSGAIVIDKLTGLMWQKSFYASDNTWTWQAALKYCEDSTYAGYSDWRLPNKNELASLLDLDKSSAPYSNFSGVNSPLRFWSSSTDTVYDYLYAWIVDFEQGSVEISTKNIRYCNFIRCVRSTARE